MRALFEQLCRYIDVDSTSGREAAYLQLLEADLASRGFRIQRQEVAPNRWNLLALPKGDLRVLFSTHIDCVPPHIPARVEAGRVYGRGASDTKGGLVAMIESAEQLDSARQWLGFLLVFGEEVDHSGAIAARDLDLKPEVIVLCEPSMCELVIGQKGMLKVALSSTGEASHSAFPELGRDALAPLLDGLQRLRFAEYPTDDVLGPTTLNIGLLDAGVAANVIPPNAYAEIIYRVVSDVDKLLTQVRSLCGPQVAVEVVSQNPPLRLPTVDGFATTIIAFNTDAYYLLDLAPVYLAGPGDIRVAHGDGEYIAVEQLAAGVEMYNALVRQLIDLP